MRWFETISEIPLGPNFKGPIGSAETPRDNTEDEIILAYVKYLRFCVIPTTTADYFTPYQLIGVVKRF